MMQPAACSIRVSCCRLSNCNNTRAQPHRYRGLRRRRQIGGAVGKQNQQDIQGEDEHGTHNLGAGFAEASKAKLQRKKQEEQQDDAQELEGCSHVFGSSGVDVVALARKESKRAVKHGEVQHQ